MTTQETLTKKSYESRCQDFAAAYDHSAAAMAPQRRIADRPDRRRDLKLWLKHEYRDPVKYQANLVRPAQPGSVLPQCAGLSFRDLMQQLFKAVALFAGSIVVMRNFGDAFAI